MIYIYTHTHTHIYIYMYIYTHTHNLSSAHLYRVEYSKENSSKKYNHGHHPLWAKAAKGEMVFDQRQKSL